MLTGAQLLRVFSAHAEVVPFLHRNGGPVYRILRARGGSSYFGTIVAEMDLYSPRTRR